jgi:hypothetical protein
MVKIYPPHTFQRCEIAVPLELKAFASKKLILWYKGNIIATSDKPD